MKKKETTMKERGEGEPREVEQGMRSADEARRMPGARLTLYYKR
jgi:hypothetical protein